MRKLIRLSLLPLAVLALLVAGCATTMVPVGHNREPGVTPAVDLFVGQKYPSFHRDDPYTPVHVTIRNNTSKPVQLRYSQFTLYNPDGRAYVIAPVREVFEWLRLRHWGMYYATYYPRPVGRYVFREGILKPHKEIQAIIFFNQATRFGQGSYRLVAKIPENNRPLEFQFRLD